MKKILFAVFFLVSAFAVNAQKASWKEMQDFHAVMSKTFHPAEEGRFQPLKDSASLLLQRAKIWQASAVPQGFKADVTQPILKKLVAQCAKVSKAVAANKSDAQLKPLIFKAHDIFHEIMEKCRDEAHH